MEVFLQKNQKIRGAREIGAAISGPRIAGKTFYGHEAFSESQFRNARLFIILFVRNFWRVCSQFWLSVRNSV